MSKLELFKAATGFVTGMGCLQIINGFVSSVVPNRTAVQKVTVFFAEVAAASLVADVVTEHLNKKIDDTVGWLAENSKN